MEDDEPVSDAERRTFREYIAQHPPEPPRTRKPRPEGVPTTAGPEAEGRHGRRRKRKSAVPMPPRTAWCRPGFQKNRFDRLRRGPYTVEAELDLHGYHAASAIERLEDFLHQCINAHKLHVRVIHGRGLRSRDGHPVLKEEVERWLKEQPTVLAFWSPTQREGGAGALNLHLRRNL